VSPALITAGASGITALALLITAVTVLVPMLRTTRATHTIVNQQRTDLIRYQRTLVQALQLAGVDVPPDQSIEPDSPAT